MGSWAQRSFFFKATKDIHGVYFQHVREYMKSWSFPAVHGNSPADCFNEQRETSSKETLKAGASELLAVYPALRQFVLESLDVPCKLKEEIETCSCSICRLKPHIDSLLNLLKLCDILKAAMRCRSGVLAKKLASELDYQVLVYLESFKLAYGEEFIGLQAPSAFALGRTTQERWNASLMRELQAR